MRLPGGGGGEPQPYRRNRFAVRCQREDVELLAVVDTVHDTLSGPATQEILQRAFHDFGESKFERLASVSAAHIYRLRQRMRYRQGPRGLSTDPTHEGDHR
jgi:hypothetical protein